MRNKRVEGAEVEPLPVDSDPNKTASENGVSAISYAKRVLSHQGPELSPRFKGANVRAALEGQGFSGADIKDVLKELGLG